jgi:hypothetical protein
MSHPTTFFLTLDREPADQENDQAGTHFWKDSAHGL